jgi:16S rRNA processing protein RimM
VPSGGERFVVGLVRGLHGLQGGVRIEPLSDEPARFEPGSRVYVEGTDRALTVDWAQADAPGLLVRFREVRTREAADGLRDTYLEAVRPSAPLDAGAYWWHEVVGVPVMTGSGEALGTVDDVFRAGGGEVYVIRGGPRGELLVPAVRAVFREFAPREGRIVVDAEALGLGPLRPRRPRGRRSSRLERVPVADRPGDDRPADGQPADDHADGPREGSPAADVRAGAGAPEGSPSRARDADAPD